MISSYPLHLPHIHDLLFLAIQQVFDHVLELADIASNTRVFFAMFAVVNITYIDKLLHGITPLDSVRQWLRHWPQS